MVQICLCVKVISSWHIYNNVHSCIFAKDHLKIVLIGFLVSMWSVQMLQSVKVGPVGFESE